MRKRFSQCVAWGMVVLFSLGLEGCVPNQPPSSQPLKQRRAASDDFPVTITDARGQKLTLDAPPQRIVSLAPSNTELLFALGLEAKLVGVTTACDYPPAAKQKPTIGGAYNMSVESIFARSPDLVVAYGTVNQKPLQQLEKANIPVLAIDAKNVPEIYDSIRLLGKATGTSQQAETIVAEMQTRLATIEKAVQDARHKPRVMIAYSVNPIYTTGPGSFIDDLVRIAGGTNVVSEALSQNIITPEQGVVMAPEVIVCAPDLCAQLSQVPGWSSIPAVRGRRFFNVTPKATLVRAVPRLVQGAEELARYLHPDRFPKP